MFPCPPNLHPSLAHLPRSQDRRRHHCGTVTAAQSRSSPELHGTVLYSLHIAFTCNPEADRDYNPIFQARKPRLMRESALDKGSVSSGRGGASAQVTTSNVPTLPLRERGQVGPAREGQPGVRGSQWVRARRWVPGVPKSGESCSDICASQWDVTVLARLHIYCVPGPS